MSGQSVIVPDIGRVDQTTGETLHEITHLGTDKGMVPLDAFPCMNCGRPGVTHIVLTLSEDGPWVFCSWDHLLDSMRIDGEPLTEAAMEAAGMIVIGPRPEA